MPKFQREYSLSIETADGSLVTIESPLTLEFNIERNTLASANTANFRILNLGELTRQRIYKSKFDISIFRSIELKAGYAGEAPVIFSGNVLEAFSYREEGSVNTYTDISCYDGGFDIVNSYSSFAVNAGKKKKVIERLAGDFPHVRKGLFSEFEGESLRGRSIMGNTFKLLTGETLDGSYIDNGVVNGLLDNDCLLGDILSIESSTGLLGSPKRADTLLIVEILFEPKLKVGQRVELNSQTERNFNGIYKVSGIHHSGTISGAVGGKCKTIASLWYGTDVLRILG
ncbi:MAG: hypothetical protein JRJ39_00305 [Deltaproteobacteria bacterium]|nr:hypothetical protein [Deltaproteobacteria bacterium]